MQKEEEEEEKVKRELEKQQERNWRKSLLTKREEKISYMRCQRCGNPTDTKLALFEYNLINEIKSGDGGGDDIMLNTIILRDILEARYLCRICWDWIKIVLDAATLVEEERHFHEIYEEQIRDDKWR